MSLPSTLVYLKIQNSRFLITHVPSQGFSVCHETMKLMCNVHETVSHMLQDF